MNVRPRSAALILSASLASACSGGHLVASRDDDDAGADTTDTADAKAPTVKGSFPQPEVCKPTTTSQTESTCGDGKDDDCDGFADCLDPDCEAKTCGSAGFSCTAGGCLQPGDGLPALPRIDNIRVTQRGDTAIVEFEPVANARDYRIYPLPKNTDVLTGAAGELVVKNAIYRCAGDRPIVARKDDPASGYAVSTSGRPSWLTEYVRTESDSLLGYVYLTPGPDRQPVYRMADPNLGGGFMNSNWSAPLYSEANHADYVVGAAARDKLLASGFRDDGIAFYVPASATKAVYRKVYYSASNGTATFFFAAGGPEYEKLSQETNYVVDSGERFKVLATEEPGSVPLRRVWYSSSFDVLAAGEPRYKRVLEQGNQPFWSLTWPGLSADTTLVVEALDQGCPFPNGYVSAHDAPADRANEPSLSLDKARLSSGEVFINGQFDPANRPRPIARAYVDVKPEPKPKMDWFESFDIGAPWEPFEITKGNNGVYIYRNSKWAIDFSGCTDNLTVGPLLGQLAVGFADYGSSCNMSLMSREIQPKLSASSYLHVRMSTNIPSTGRRYPQLMLTTTKVLNPGDVQPLDAVPMHARLGPVDKNNPGPEKSIIVQPFGANHALNLQFCDQRGWGVNVQCPQINIYGYSAGSDQTAWKSPWLPNPVLGELAGFDRPVQFDVYASTERVYVYVDDKPFGCAVLPAGRMPEGDVTVSYRAVLYHSDIDESVVPATSGHQYLRRYSLMHMDRTLDDLGIDQNVPAPMWDESLLPCGTRLY
ncbi:MAG TPA: hypothetical protein VI299_10770 [Polyangiales bacterium]